MERSIKCPDCPFEFCSLIDAGDFHAYVCPGCGWTSESTSDRRPGNRPPDVCALCDRAIESLVHPSDYHLLLGTGRGWIHGGGRKYIPFHSTCIEAAREKSCFSVEMAQAYVAQREGVDIDPMEVYTRLRAEQAGSRLKRDRARQLRHHDRPDEEPVGVF